MPSSSSSSGARRTRLAGVVEAAVVGGRGHVAEDLLEVLAENPAARERGSFVQSPSLNQTVVTAW